MWCGAATKITGPSLGTLNAPRGLISLKKIFAIIRKKNSAQSYTIAVDWGIVCNKPSREVCETWSAVSGWSFVGARNHTSGACIDDVTGCVM